MNLNLCDFHEESIVMGIAEDFSKYLDAPIDVYFAIQNYLWGGQADYDRLIDKVHIGKTNTKEILKFRDDKNVNFTK